jgi:hypothetical protein
MKARTAAALIPPALAALAVAALTLYAYRALPTRPFAADDYQWLLGVRGLSFGDVARKAFDIGAQSHFYRPLVWLLFWAQARAFGLDPRGFHAVSLGLHLLNAGLVGTLAYRLQIADCRLQIGTDQRQSTIYNLQSAIPIVAAAVVALHPAPFEAVVWVSAQSELLAAALLLISLHLWLSRPRTPSTTLRAGKDQGEKIGWPRAGLWSLVFRPWSALATLALGLALLAKESAVIGLPLLVLIGRGSQGETQHATRNTQYETRASRFTPYVLPTLLTLAYVALQVAIVRRNYLVEQGGYGLGPQIVLNPLRSLALIVAPLPGTERADAAWLVPLGALVALALLLSLVVALRCRIGPGHRQSTICNLQSAMVLALALTLLPTAPFASPPDSRYLYLPVMASALIIACAILRTEHREPRTKKRLLMAGSWFLVVGSMLLVWGAMGELSARESRFAAASGPGGSLWRVASAVCAEGRPERMVIVEPPLAPPHAEAIVGLACGADVRTRVVGRDQIDRASKGHSVVIAFPNGSAEVQRRT